LVDFCFEPVTNNLVLLNMKELIYYDDKNGAYLRTLKLPVFANNFDYSNYGYISLVNAGIDDNLIITDSSGKKVSSFFKYVKETKLLLNRPFIRNGASDLLFLTNLDYTIYRINGKQISPYIKIDFMQNMYSQNDLELLTEDSKNINNFYHMTNYFEDTDKIFISYFYKKILYYLFSDKNTRNTLVVKYFEIENDITFSKLLPRILTNDSSGTFISFVEPGEFKGVLLNKIITDNRLIEIADSSRLTDNPILFLFKIK
jgi:hypothetical protein